MPTSRYPFLVLAALLTVAALLSACGANSKSAGTDAPAAAAPAAPALHTYDDHSGAFLQLKAKPGQRDALLANLQESARTQTLNSSNRVFIIHTFPTDTQTVYVYVLHDDARAYAPGMRAEQLMDMAQTDLIANATVTPLKPLLGKY